MEVYDLDSCSCLSGHLAADLQPELPGLRASVSSGQGFLAVAAVCSQVHDAMSILLNDAQLQGHNRFCKASHQWNVIQILAITNTKILTMARKCLTYGWSCHLGHDLPGTPAGRALLCFGGHVHPIAGSRLPFESWPAPPR